jgi:FHA domain-containing protein
MTKWPVIHASTSAEDVRSDRISVTVESGGLALGLFAHNSEIRVKRSIQLNDAPALAGNVLCLPSRYISRNGHCLIAAVNHTQVLVTDLNSTNGTRVNGNPINSTLRVTAPCLVELFPFQLLVQRSRSPISTAPLRENSTPPPSLRFDEVSGDIRLPSGQTVPGLTPFQRAILETLIRRRPHWTTSAELALIVGGGTTAQSVYNQIHQIRQCLESAERGAANLIRTQRGRGYSLRTASSG